MLMFLAIILLKTYFLHHLHLKSLSSFLTAGTYPAFYTMHQEPFPELLFFSVVDIIVVCDIILLGAIKLS